MRIFAVDCLVSTSTVRSDRRGGIYCSQKIGLPCYLESLPCLIKLQLALNFWLSEIGQCVALGRGLVAIFSSRIFSSSFILHLRLPQ